MPATARYQRGMSVLEMALVLVVAGVLLASIMAARNQGGDKAPVSSMSALDGVVTALFAYAQRHYRLPCPDIDGDDLEDAVNGVCLAGDSTAGGVPFKTIGLALSSQLADGGGNRFVYGVYRDRAAADPARNADLTLNAERTVDGAGTPEPHPAGHASYQNLDDFRQAVLNAWAMPATAADIFVTGDDAGAGAADCIAPRLVGNMAFIVAYAGIANADHAGSDFDGPHLAAGWSPAMPRWQALRTASCFAGPGKAVSARYDDLVRAVSFPELLGALSQ